MRWQQQQVEVDDGWSQKHGRERAWCVPLGSKQACVPGPIYRRKQRVCVCVKSVSHTSGRSWSWTSSGCKLAALVGSRPREGATAGASEGRSSGWCLLSFHRPTGHILDGVTGMASRARCLLGCACSSRAGRAAGRAWGPVSGSCWPVGLAVGSLVCLGTKGSPAAGSTESEAERATTMHSVLGSLHGVGSLRWLLPLPPRTR